jgi:hypothetical protein
VSPTAAVRTLLSAADHRYFRTLCQLLLSVERHDALTSLDVVVFDLGLTSADRSRLAARFPWCRLETFAFDRYPPHVRRLESCAWKPIAIDEMLEQRGGFVVWLDSATIVRQGLDPIFSRLARDGLFTLAGQSPIRRWCHEATLRYMRVPEDDAGKRCRSAGVLGFDASRPAIRALVAGWRACALVKACIDPPGASRANHRYDQAILSNLLYASERDAGIVLSNEEIDIGSITPVTWASTRNKVAPWVPLALDPIVRAYYAAYKRADRAWLAARRGTRVRDAAFAAEDVLKKVLGAWFLRRASARARRSLRGKASLAGRRCHCDPAPLHLVHSEGLRESCDVVIDYASNVEHPERPQVPPSVLSTIAAEIAAGDIVYVKTDHLEAFVNEILPSNSGPIVLVTGDSDASAVASFERLLSDDRILHWFAQNCDVSYDHPRLTRIPIGVDNPVYTKMEKRLGFAVAMLLGKIPFDRTSSRNVMGDQARLLAARSRLSRTIREKPARVLCTFHRNQQLLSNADTIPDRVEAGAALRDAPHCHFIASRLRQDDYWAIHDDFAFELSPRGNGLDCFRTWECLVLETIPIVKTSPLDALYRQEGFPVVIVESFREVTAVNLGRWKAQLEGHFTPKLLRTLTNDYWLQRIQQAVRSREELPEARVDAGARV